jgi:hypothetical protein
MKRLADIDIQMLRALLDYDPATGDFVWRERPAELFRGDIRACAVWNARYAGKKAGTVSKWGYLVVSLFKQRYFAQRLAYFLMTEAWPAYDVDHVNRNKLDNRWENLRPATRAQNTANTSKQSNNTSGFKGVSYYKSRGKWEANLCRKRLGYFDCPVAAHLAYVVASRKRFKEFAEAV